MKYLLVEYNTRLKCLNDKWYTIAFSYRYTLSALQILAICDKMDLIDKERVSKYIKELYQENGSFFNDEEICDLKYTVFTETVDRQSIKVKVIKL